MTRALIAARISQLSTDGQNRVDRDDENARAWAEHNGRTVVAVSEDRGVSGAVAPEKRAALGPWLTDPSRILRYDEIVASSLDRLGRNAADLFHLREWAEEHGKKITILSPALTWPPAPDDFASPIIWDVLGRVAEMELQLIRKRYSDMRQTIRANGGLYGRPPFGYRVEGDNYRKTLVPDEELVPVVRGMVDRAVRGDTFDDIASWLADQGQPGWRPSNVKRYLASPALKGRRLNDEGDVIMRYGGILTPSEWGALQKAIDRRPGERGPQADTALLTGMVQCRVCGGQMYRHQITRDYKGKTYVYASYRCRGKRCVNAVKVEELDTWLSAWFEAGPFSTREITRTELQDTDGERREELAEIIGEQTRAVQAGDMTRVLELQDRRDEIEAAPPSDPVVVEVPTGETAGGMWRRLDTAGRRAYLQEARVVVAVYPAGSPDEEDGERFHVIRGNPTILTGVDYGALVRSLAV